MIVSDVRLGDDAFLTLATYMVLVLRRGIGLRVNILEDTRVGHLIYVKLFCNFRAVPTWCHQQKRSLPLSKLHLTQQLSILNIRLGSGRWIGDEALAP